MPKQPISRKPQSVEDMTTELVAARTGKMYRATTYKAVSDDLKREALVENLDQQIELLRQRVYERGKVNLDNVDEVREIAFDFMQACRSSQTFPTMLAFSAALGISRTRLYSYIDTHDNETTRLLDMLRSSWASIIAQQSLSRQTDNATAIFLLKNSGQGLTDRVEISATTTQTPLDTANIDAEQIAQKYSELPKD